MIRQMSMDDLQAVEALEQRCFRSSWNEEQLRYELEENAFRMPWCWKKRERSWGA